MSVCEFLHKELRKLPRFKAGYDPKIIPKNGLYFLFENGESGHDGERIVRVGTHTGQNNLPQRLKEHLYKKNKDRSVFRKHIGRCLLAQRNDPFLEMWDKDLTTKKDRERFEHLLDKNRLAQVEEVVSDYMNTNFSFVILRVDDKSDRLVSESGLLSAIAACAVCRASDNWLGKHHPNPLIREGGLWNIQGLAEPSIRQADLERLLF